MILDAETLELSNSIEALLEAVEGENGQVKPELMESVLEVATNPCRNTKEAGAELRELRSSVATLARDRGLAIGAAGTHPLAMWGNQRIVARPRLRDLLAALRLVARPGPHRGAASLSRPRSGAPLRGASGADLRRARARGSGRPRQGHPRGEWHARAHGDAARAVGQLAVLASRCHRAALHPHADLPRLSAGGHPAALRQLRGL